MPGDSDDRLRQVEVIVGSLQQRVQDHEGDIHRFGPLVTEQALLRQMVERELRSLGKSVDGAHEAIRHLDQRLDEESRERVQGQLERKRELEEAIEQRRREMQIADDARQVQHAELKTKLRLAALSLVGLMITSGVSVVIAIIAAKGGSPG